MKTIEWNAICYFCTSDFLVAHGTHTLAQTLSYAHVHLYGKKRRNQQSARFIIIICHIFFLSASFRPFQMSLILLWTERCVASPNNKLNQKNIANKKSFTESLITILAFILTIFHVSFN